MNIILNIILSKYMGIGGLALATSISALFCTVLLFISLRKKIGALGVLRDDLFYAIGKVDVLVGILRRGRASLKDIPGYNEMCIPVR